MDDRSDVTQLVTTIHSNIQNLSQKVQHLDALVAKIGGPEDGERLREQIAETTAGSNQLSKDTNSLMKKLVTLSNEERSVPTLKVQRERYMDELIAVLNKLQAAQRTAAAKEKESMNAVYMTDKEISEQIEKVDDRQVQEKQQLHIQHQAHLNELQERSEAMWQLNQDIGDVTQIMKDLARIVHDQGEIVDSIEANVEHASLHVEQYNLQGATNVQRALVYQRNARQKKLFLVAFFVILICIILLAIYLMYRN
uniref:t-SNARE coiled-coil homology domain-containing protein n=1 Tax=Syphacia muris TaxID=451379 RepID=A0A0N5AYS3_9BILA